MSDTAILTISSAISAVASLYILYLIGRDSKRNIADKSFEELKIGDTFIFCGTLYVKTNEDGNVNAVWLPDGICSYFNRDDKCFPVECDIVIKDKKEND